MIGLRDMLLRCKTRLALAMITCALAPTLLGCTVTKDYVRPKTVVPKNWRISLKTAANMANEAWWKQFGDPVLDRLIKTALNKNKDVRIAADRVEQYAAALQITRAGYFPQLGYGVSADRASQSLELPTRYLSSPSQGNRSFWSLDLPFNVSWELDIWGKIKRSTEAARADLLSSEENRRAVIMTLVSQVAESYINLLSLDRQLAQAKDDLRSRGDEVAIFENKFKGGNISGMELAQVKTSYQQVSEAIPDLQREIALQEDALSLLIGRNPGPILCGKKLDELLMPKIPAGLPSTLLLRRPDIREREQDMIAANARVGVAITQYFPDLSLTGVFGFSSQTLATWLEGPANYWRAGAAAEGLLFTGGRIFGNVKEMRALQRQAVNEYLKAVQNAFGEVNDALISVQKYRKLLAIRAESVKTLKDYVHRARVRYNEMLVPYLDVLTSEGALFNAELAYIQTKDDLFAAMVEVYKAMGGGWVAKAEQDITAPEATPKVNPADLKSSPKRAAHSAARVRAHQGRPLSKEKGQSHRPAETGKPQVSRIAGPTSPQISYSEGEEIPKS